MEDLIKYYEYFVLALILIILIVVYFNAIELRKINKFFSSKRFRITSIFEVDPISLKESFSISIFNNNINDSRVVALGFVYKSKNIDYFKAYLQQKELGLESKIVIPSRDSINIKVESNEIKTIIRDLNNGEKRTKPIDVFAIDSLGITTSFRAPSIKKNINKLINKDIKNERIARKEEQKTLRLEVRSKRQKAREIKKAMRREKWNVSILKLRTKFKRK